MAVKRVSPAEALALMREQGYSYLDVRSVPEFDQGHPAGAYNVPLVHMGPGGNQPNVRFLEVVQRHFRKDARLVVGCRTAGRSQNAIRLLEEAGYSDVVLQQSGFVGTSAQDAGWGSCGLPTSRSPGPGRSWRDLAEPAE